MIINKPTEREFEDLIERHLIDEAGYHQLRPADYDRTLCFCREEVLHYLHKTQPEVFQNLHRRGVEAFFRRLSGEIEKRGVLDVLRRGIKDRGDKIRLYTKLPRSRHNPDHQREWALNRFGVCRQLAYSVQNGNSLDLGLFLNGLPIATAELKSVFTSPHQTVEHAKAQYRRDRDPRGEPLLKFKRCLVHFAVDTERVFMTTKLAGAKTFFLPFNQGHEDGAGNPPVEQGQRSQYLWREVWTRRSWSNLIENFVQLVREQDPDTKKWKETQFFPRYHQLRVVRKLLDHAQRHGAGQRYLVQHSAGSGKSNSITWLAHQLTELFDPTGERRVFDTIIVVTDRRVLDKQIRTNIRNFAQVDGVVAAITQGSTQLGEALTGGKQIIISTVQKFPWVVDKIGGLGDRRFAIVIDEAHSGQTGDNAAHMNVTLAHRGAPTTNALAAEPVDANDQYQADVEDPEPRTGEDVINELMEKRRMLPNASYFAFTATPKNKTLEIFGEKRADGKFHAFDLYSMKQAIEEGFILDVLKNYTRYESYYNLVQKTEDNPEFDQRLAQKRLRAYVEQHPASIKKRTRIMVDHFQTEVRRLINGQAKAMVVCKSIVSAVRYFRAFQTYLRETQSDLKAIVAFSGQQTVDGVKVSEASLNKFSTADIPKRFERPEYRFLIVANKFQTGFDQPLLHTMYVDKKLSGVQAVQTLSRLNRAHTGKDSTFVLDFYNDPDIIQKSFVPYYTTTVLSEATNPNALYDLQLQLEDAQIFTEDEVRELTDLLVTNQPRTTFEGLLGRAVERFRRDLDEDAQGQFRQRGRAFVRTYGYLSKILDFAESDWERLYAYLRLLLPLLRPEDQQTDLKGLLASVDLDSYRTILTSTQDIALVGGGTVDPATISTSGTPDDPEVDSLAVIVAAFNERFGNIDWLNDDKVRQVYLEQIPAQIAAEAETMTLIQNSDKQNARLTAADRVEALVQQFMFTSTDAYKMFADNADFKRMYVEFVFERLWGGGASANP